MNIDGYFKAETFDRREWNQFLVQSAFANEHHFAIARFSNGFHPRNRYAILLASFTYFFIKTNASRIYRYMMLIFKLDYSQSTHVMYEYFILYFTHVSVHDTFVHVEFEQRLSRPCKQFDLLFAHK